MEDAGDNLILFLLISFAVASIVTILTLGVDAYDAFLDFLEQIKDLLDTDSTQAALVVCALLLAFAIALLIVARPHIQSFGRDINANISSSFTSIWNFVINLPKTCIWLQKKAVEHVVDTVHIPELLGYFGGYWFSLFALCMICMVYYFDHIQSIEAANAAPLSSTPAPNDGDDDSSDSPPADQGDSGPPPPPSPAQDPLQPSTQSSHPPPAQDPPPPRAQNPPAHVPAVSTNSAAPLQAPAAQGSSAHFPAGSSSTESSPPSSAAPVSSTAYTPASLTQRVSTPQDPSPGSSSSVPSEDVSPTDTIPSTPVEGGANSATLIGESSSRPTAARESDLGGVSAPDATPSPASSVPLAPPASDDHAQTSETSTNDGVPRDNGKTKSKDQSWADPIAAQNAATDAALLSQGVDLGPNTSNSAAPVQRNLEFASTAGVAESRKNQPAGVFSAQYAEVTHFDYDFYPSVPSSSQQALVPWDDQDEAALVVTEDSMDIDRPASSVLFGRYVSEKQHVVQEQRQHLMQYAMEYQKIWDAKQRQYAAPVYGKNDQLGLSIYDEKSEDDMDGIEVLPIAKVVLFQNGRFQQSATDDSIDGVDQTPVALKHAFNIGQGQQITMQAPQTSSTAFLLQQGSQGLAGSRRVTGGTQYQQPGPQLRPQVDRTQQSIYELGQWSAQQQAKQQKPAVQPQPQHGAMSNSGQNSFVGAQLNGAGPSETATSAAPPTLASNSSPAAPAGQLMQATWQNGSPYNSMFFGMPSISAHNWDEADLNPGPAWRRLRLNTPILAALALIHNWAKCDGEVLNSINMDLGVSLSFGSSEAQAAIDIMTFSSVKQDLDRVYFRLRSLREFATTSSDNVWDDDKFPVQELFMHGTHAVWKSLLEILDGWLPHAANLRNTDTTWVVSIASLLRNILQMMEAANIRAGTATTSQSSPQSNLYSAPAPLPARPSAGSSFQQVVQAAQQQKSSTQSAPSQPLSQPSGSQSTTANTAAPAAPTPPPAPLTFDNKERIVFTQDDYDVTNNHRALEHQHLPRELAKQLVESFVNLSGNDVADIKDKIQRKLDGEDERPSNMRIATNWGMEHVESKLKRAAIYRRYDQIGTYGGSRKSGPTRWGYDTLTQTQWKAIYEKTKDDVIALQGLYGTIYTRKPQSLIRIEQVHNWIKTAATEGSLPKKASNRNSARK